MFHFAKIFAHSHKELRSFVKKTKTFYTLYQCTLYIRTIFLVCKNNLADVFVLT